VKVEVLALKDHGQAGPELQQAAAMPSPSK
jgi:hypothetical protein